jgi:hypothetical protein
MILMLLFIIVLHDGQCQVEEPKERRLKVLGLRKKVQYIKKFGPLAQLAVRSECSNIGHVPLLSAVLPNTGKQLP